MSLLMEKPKSGEISQVCSKRYTKENLSMKNPPFCIWLQLTSPRMSLAIPLLRLGYLGRCTFLQPFSENSLSAGESGSRSDKLEGNVSSHHTSGLVSCISHPCYQHSLLTPLTILFTLSFVHGHLPSLWKSANITVLHKKGAKTDHCNNRPISLLLIISKVVESINALDIKSFLFSNGLISDLQFGFRPGQSTLERLLLLS